MADMPDTDDKYLIDLYIIGLRPDLQATCSYDRTTRKAWACLDDLSEAVLWEDENKILTQSNSKVNFARTQAGYEHKPAQRGTKRDNPDQDNSGAAVNYAGNNSGGNKSGGRSNSRDRGRSSIRDGGGGSGSRMPEPASTRPPAGTVFPMYRFSELAIFKQASNTRDPQKSKKAHEDWDAWCRHHNVCLACGGFNKRVDANDNEIEDTHHRLDKCPIKEQKNAEVMFKKVSQGN